MCKMLHANKKIASYIIYIIATNRISTKQALYSHISRFINYQ